MEHITTLTMNPAVDVTTSVVDVVADRKLRCSAALRDPGGGGINVARVVNLLGGRALALWTRGGPTGAVLADLLVREAVEHRELAIRGDVRESFTVMEGSGRFCLTLEASVGRASALAECRGARYD